MNNKTAYPLSWPTGWPKTEPGRRESGRFQTSLPSALAEMQKQIRLMGGKDLVISSNYTLGASNPKDPGVVVYFDWRPDPNKYPPEYLAMAIPCDRLSTPTRADQKNASASSAKPTTLPWLL